MSSGVQEIKSTFYENICNKFKVNKHSDNIFKVYAFLNL